MRNMPLLIGFAIAVTMSIASPTGILAQPTGPEQDDRLLHSGPECIGAPVLDAPFSAEAVTTWYPSARIGTAELRSTVRYYRDRAGRVRVDFVGGMTPQRVLVTADAGS